MEKKKRQLSENSLKNLEKRKSFSKDNVEFSLECQRKGAESRKRNNIIKKALQEEINKQVHSRFTMCDDIYQLIQENGGIEEVIKMAIHNCIERGQTKDLVKLLEMIKPSERQDIKISGDVGITNTMINIIPIKGDSSGNQS